VKISHKNKSGKLLAKAIKRITTYPEADIGSAIHHNPFVADITLILKAVKRRQVCKNIDTSKLHF